MAVEQVIRALPAPGGEAAAVLVSVFALVAEPFLVAPVNALVPAQVVLFVKIGKEGGEAFIQPNVPPVLASDEVAKPLVRKLVSNEACRIDIKARPLVVERVLRQGSCRGVFHSTVAEVENTDLVVLRPRVADPGY